MNRSIKKRPRGERYPEVPNFKKEEEFTTLEYIGLGIGSIILYIIFYVSLWRLFPNRDEINIYLKLFIALVLMVLFILFSSTYTFGGFNYMMKPTL